MNQPQDLDRLSINTIRTLAMDAVQAANSGHPGAPMGLAPVAYCLWQLFLRYDPEQPIWPNRDRFVLSVGHVSMLLYALLHLTGVKAVNPDYETLGEPSAPLDAIKRFRQLDSPCAGHPEYRWTTGVETTTGPLGQGVATSVGMAIAQKWLAATYRPGFKLFDYDIYALAGDGCMMEGLSGEAAACRAPEAREPLLDLRRQQDHHRGFHRARVQRGRRPALRGLRMERHPRRGRERSRRARPGLRAVPRHHRPADLHQRAQPHRLRLAEQAGQLQRSWQPARRGGGAADQARLRLAGRREVPRARRGRGGVPRRDRQARPRAQQRLGRAFRRLRSRVYGPRRPGAAHVAATAARRMGRGTAELPGGRDGRRGARRVGEGAERHRPAGAVADRRLRRPRAVHQHAAHLRGRRRLRGRRLRRPELPLRRARARHECGPERHVAVEDAPTDRGS